MQDQFSKEAAKSLSSGIEHFEEFLDANYSDSSEIAKVNHFVSDLYDHIYFSKVLPDWTIDLVQTHTIDTIIENSGLRKEIRVYGFEKENGKAHDSLLYFNWIGDYYNALRAVSLNNDPIIKYTKDLENSGGFSFIMAARILKESNCYNLQDAHLLKRIVFAELYIDLIKWHGAQMVNPAITLPEIARLRS